MTLDEIISKVESEGFQWAACKDVSGSYTAYVTEHKDTYIADSLADGLLCHEGNTPVEALEKAFTTELSHRESRRAVGQLSRLENR